MTGAAHGRSLAILQTQGNMMIGPEEHANEMDVRAEIAEPFLAALGYKRGTPANIDREARLTYARRQLGRKKKSDPPLAGRPDYILSVVGFGNWVLDTKAPAEALCINDAEQVLSYARHPEVAGHYAALLNGGRFVLYRAGQPSTEKPLLDIPVSSPGELAATLEGLLSPGAIRRDCRPPKVDLATPLAEGLRSSAVVTGGSVNYSATIWEADFPMPPSLQSQLNEAARRLSNYIAPIKTGRVWRDQDSRIRAKLEWGAPSPAAVEFAKQKGLFDIEYVSLDERISSDPDRPTAFDAIGGVTVETGERAFDMVKWDTVIIDTPCSVVFAGKAVGSIVGNRFEGSFQSEAIFTFTAAPGVHVILIAQGTFDVVVSDL